MRLKTIYEKENNKMKEERKEKDQVLVQEETVVSPSVVPSLPSVESSTVEPYSGGLLFFRSSHNMVTYRNTVYTHADAYFQAVREHEPIDPKTGLFENVEEISRNLTALLPPEKGAWYLEPDYSDYMTIENWILNGEELFHRHPELGYIFDDVEPGYVIAEVFNSECVLCHDKIAGELGMIHKFYKF